MPGPKVTLTFAGDSKQLERAFDRVERKTKEFGRSVDRSSDLLDGFARAGEHAAGGFSLRFSQRIGPLLANAPVSAPLIAAFAAAAAPAAAALTSGILLGLGGGVIAAGIGLIAKDPKVTAAAKRLRNRFLDKDLGEDKDNIKTAERRLEAAFARLKKARALGQKKAVESALYDIRLAKIKLAEANDQLADSMEFNKRNVSLRDAAKPFIEPTVRALDTFTERVAPKLTASFERMAKVMAPVLDKLAPAFATMVEKALPGIEKAVAASVPLFEKLAEHAPKIGEAVSKFFKTIAEGAPSALKFLELLLKMAEFALPFLATQIKILTSFFEYLHYVWTQMFKGIGAAWNWLKGATSASVKWISDKFNALVGFLGKLPRRVGGAFSGMFDGIKSAFRSAVNWVIDRWNSFSIPGISTPFGTIGGFSTPNLPRYHQGGVVPGRPGQEVMAILQAGERVIPAGRSSTPTTVIEIRSGGSRLDDALVEILRNAVRVRGGNVQLVLGGNRG